MLIIMQQKSNVKWHSIHVNTYYYTCMAVSTINYVIMIIIILYYVYSYHDGKVLPSVFGHTLQNFIFSLSSLNVTG